MRLLVVEDDPDLNRQLTTALSDTRYVVDRAFDGEEGHYLGDGEPYDAVVLDIGLPKMDGISVLEAWRRNGRAMPVLILTARDRWSDKVQIDAGISGSVAKPFHLEEILARIRALLCASCGHAHDVDLQPVTLVDIATAVARCIRQSGQDDFARMLAVGLSDAPVPGVWSRAPNWSSTSTIRTLIATPTLLKFSSAVSVKSSKWISSRPFVG